VSLGPTQRALAVGAHPDDAEFGCFGTLQRFDAAAVVILTAGEHGGESERRRTEAAAAAKIIGAEVTIADQPDTSLAAGPAIAAVRDAIAAFRPDVVFCPSRHDDHQDHVTAAHACYVATRGFAGIVLAYLTPSAVARFAPQLLVPLTEAAWSTKLAALHAHHSQAHRGYLAEDYLETTARYWGQQAGNGAARAEPFEVLRWVEPPVPAYHEAVAEWADDG
jgi:LmbE family N-acetylglucosaminyl deacetylase